MNSLLNILGIDFTNISLNELTSIISSKIELREKLIIGYLNTYTCNYISKHKDFKSIMKQFNIVHADGVGVYLASRFLYCKKGLYNRSTGTDLYFKLFKEFPFLKYFLLGGVEDCSNRIKENKVLGKKPSNINIVGNLYNLNTPNIDIMSINQSGADILMVALGTPYQEEWIIENKDKLNVPVIIAVGSGLDFLAGVKKRAPLWMQRVGVEWLYRLFQEPKRLWKRYVFGIPVFIFHILIQKVKLLLKKV